MNEPSKAKPSTTRGGSAIHKNTAAPHRKDKGRAAEEAAASYLEQAGWLIVERNWSCRSGELDIVAEKGETLLFVEVRSRSGIGYGMPAESIDGRKIQQVRRTAEVYLHRFGISDRQIRFDAVAVMLGRNLEIRSLEHIEDAF
ncbi:YraN family protein [Saccharibacillus sacchari]|uniref:YraN family protein n=1 Tax=Saccharibacillus sacchari TaxID=456493 RepID=A0ACC6P6S6_9BACL